MVSQLASGGKEGWLVGGLPLLTLNGVQSALLISSVKIPKPLVENNTEFDFIVEIDTPGADDGAGAGEDNGGRGLEEEERLLRPDVVELLDVVTTDVTTAVLAFMHHPATPLHKRLESVKYQASKKDNIIGNDGAFKLQLELTHSCVQCRQSC